MTDMMPTIRRGYRYVVAYQRRLLDCVAALNEQIGAMGYEQDGWKPLYYGKPKHEEVGGCSLGLGLLAALRDSVLLDAEGPQGERERRLLLHTRPCSRHRFRDAQPEGRGSPTT